MRKTRYGLLLSSLLLIILGCFHIAPAQPPSGHADNITVEDVKKYIDKSRKAHETWGLIEEKYVLENFDRPRLKQTIDNWQAKNRIKLSREVRIRVLVDYLLTELNSMRALNPVLDSIAKGESTSFAKQLKTQVASTTFTQYQSAKVQIEVNIPSVDITIDGDSLGRSQNADTFCITPGTPHLLLVTQTGFTPCAETVTAGAGRTVIVKCTLNPFR